MKKISVIGILAAMATILFFGTVYSQEDITVVDNTVFDNPQRPAAVFIHDEHNETAELEECSECHHIYEDGKKVEDESSEDQRCSDCHEQNGSDDMPQLMNAFHANCKGCHLAQKKGPLTCGECHLR